MLKFSDYTSIVEAEISRLEPMAQKLPELYAPIVYGMAAGGKRLRPVLALMAAEAVSGAYEGALSAALGLEMFHNFTLLHDDVMDNSDTRRGRLTVHKKWDANTAILSGDTMLTLATQLVARVPDACLRIVLDTFNDMAIEVYEGQALDMKFETEAEVSLDDYLTMIGKKTGALLGAACKIGALAAGASASVADKFYEYGMKMGIAFQIQDDYLDVYGDAATFGKPIGGDILNDKKTYLWIKARESQNARESLDMAMKIAAPEQKIKVVRNIYTMQHLPEICTEATDRYCREALRALRDCKLSEEVFEAFRKLTDKILGRKK